MYLFQKSIQRQWLGSADHKEYSIMKMSLEKHKETLQYLRWLDRLQRQRDNLPITSSASKIQFLAPVCSPRNVISASTRRINLKDTELSYFPTQEHKGQDNLDQSMSELVFHLGLADVKVNVIDSLFESSLEKSNILL